MTIEITEEAFLKVLAELAHVRQQRDELQQNQTKLLNEVRDQDLSCQLRREFECGLDKPLLLSEVDSSMVPGRDIAKLAYELATEDRAHEITRLRLGIPRAAVATLIHRARLSGSTSRGTLISEIDKLLRENGYRGR